MKRDMDLIRDLLLKLEAIEMPMGGVAVIGPEDPVVAIDGRTPTEIDYHLSLLREAGLFDTGGVEPMVGVGFRRLTWAGHDFVDSVRDPAIWRLTKEGAVKAGGSTIDILAALAKGFLKKTIEQHTGVQLDL